MSSFQKRLDELHPHVIGIRYIEGSILIDVVFPSGWSFIDSTLIKALPGKNEANYFMVYSESKSHGVDELMDFIESNINRNLEKEKKGELFKKIVDELKTIFKNLPYNDLLNLKFDIEKPNDSLYDLDEPTTHVDTTPEIVIINKEETVKINAEQPITHYVDDEGNEIKLSEEELEQLEEDERAKKFLENKSKLIPPHQPKQKKIVQQKVSVESNSGGCNCPPDKYCSKCMLEKGF
jgi:hypothetical protein